MPDYKQVSWNLHKLSPHFMLFMPFTPSSSVLLISVHQNCVTMLLSFQLLIWQRYSEPTTAKSNSTAVC